MSELGGGGRAGSEGIPVGRSSSAGASAGGQAGPGRGMNSVAEPSGGEVNTQHSEGGGGGMAAGSGGYAGIGNADATVKGMYYDYAHGQNGKPSMASLEICTKRECALLFKPPLDISTNKNTAKTTTKFSLNRQMAEGLQ